MKINFSILWGVALSLFVAFFGISLVSAETLTQEVAVGFNYSNNLGNRQWSAFSANNLSKTFSPYALVDTINTRFTITNNFKKDYTYIISYDITNNWTYPDTLADSFYEALQNMVPTDNLGCYIRSNSSFATGTTCFTSGTYTLTQKTTNSVTFTITFTPVVDLYRILLQREMSTYGSEFESNGYTISNINFQVVSSGTGEIIANNNENTQNIINNQNNNTSSIINAIDGAINGLTDQSLDIEERNLVCQVEEIDKTYNREQGYLLADGTIASDSSGWYYTDYLIVRGAIEVTSAYGSSPFLCYYDIDKTLISCTSYSLLSSGDLISPPSNTYYARFSIRATNNRPRFMTTVCKNSGQATTDAVQAVNDNIMDSTPPDTSDLSNAAGWLPAGPVDSILTLPASMLQNLTSSLSGTCQPVSLPLPYLDNKNIVLPCVSTIYEEMGLTTFFNWVGGIASAFILFKYLMKLYHWVDDTLTLRENTQSDWGGD